MNDLMTIGAATSPVLGSGWSGEAAGARRTAPPVHRVKGTGLPFVGVGMPVGAVGGCTRVDQLQGTTVSRIQAATDPGIPPRRGPVRC